MNRTWRQLVLAALAVGGLSPVGAGTAKADPTYNRCMKSAATMVAMGDCGGQWIKREEAGLANGWREALARLGGSKSPAGSALLAEQRAWIAYKDKACRFWWTGDFGSNGRQIEGPACIAGVIGDRTRFLENVAVGGR